MNVRLLSKILPGVRFTVDVADESIVYAKFDGKWQDLTDPGMWTDFVCGELERALLKDERVTVLRLVCGCEGPESEHWWSVEFIHPETGKTFSRGSKATKLASLLEAAEPLYMEGA